MTEAEINIAAVRRLQFCAGHRVYKHESKCAYLHGHNYVVFFHAKVQSDAKEKRGGGAGLDQLGRVIDFAVLKERFAPWIEANWDHGFILWEKDEEAIAALKQVSEQKLFLLKANPTAENMAIYLLQVVAPAVLSGSGVEVTKVVLWETENCFVEVGEA
jgi:6-pyruvoyltetrahydropterin/6-carboxytetrahydropterin synthase